jgi:hypothetical protein
VTPGHAKEEGMNKVETPQREPVGNQPHPVKANHQDEEIRIQSRRNKNILNFRSRPIFSYIVNDVPLFHKISKIPGTNTLFSKFNGYFQGIYSKNQRFFLNFCNMYG